MSESQETATLETPENGSSGEMQPKTDDHDNGERSVAYEPEDEDKKVVVHLVGGEIGGVGKSTVSKSLIYFFQKNNKDIVVVDCDRTNQDVYSLYCNNGVLAAKQLALSDKDEREDEADNILNWSIQYKLPVVVNLPAQVENIIQGWIDRTIIPAMDFISDEHVNIQINHWFVSNGSPASLKIFLDSLLHYGGSIQHIFVRNTGLKDAAWNNVENSFDLTKVTSKIISLPPARNNSAPVQIKNNFDPAPSTTDASGKPILPVIQMEFPRLPPREKDKLAAQGVTFTQALEPRPVDRKAWELWERSRLYNFLDSANAVFTATELFS